MFLEGNKVSAEVLARDGNVYVRLVRDPFGERPIWAKLDFVYDMEEVYQEWKLIVV